jgi:hypothetical protein
MQERHAEGTQPVARLSINLAHTGISSKPLWLNVHHRLRTCSTQFWLHGAAILGRWDSLPQRLPPCQPAAQHPDLADVSLLWFETAGLHA